MATIKPAVFNERGARLVVWEGLTGNDVGEPVVLPAYSLSTVQITDGPGFTGTVTIRGANSVDPNAPSTILKTTAGLEAAVTSPTFLTFITSPRVVTPQAHNITGVVRVAAYFIRRAPSSVLGVPLGL
jgi:hypothetical protein